jgi:hypothetical protein
MKKFTVVCCICLGFMVLALPGFSPAAAADDAATGAKLDEQKYPVLSQSEVAVLKGDLWTTASQDSKVAYVWGMCSMIEVERIVMTRIPEVRVRNVSAVFAEALQNVPMTDIVRAVDDYYTANPGKLDVPVLRIIWDTMVKSKVTTGVAGRAIK